MKYSRHLACLILAFVAPWASAADGLVTVKSPYSAHSTMNRLESIVLDRGLTLIARIDHAAGAANVGMTLRPTELLIFGNPQGGTPFIECAQTAGIDLPLKALVWEDAENQVWLGYNDIDFLAQRHRIPTCAPIASLAKIIAALVAEAVAP